jgi:hypothetical protein
VQSKNVPLIIFLGALFGFKKVAETIGTTGTFVPKETKKADIPFNTTEMLSVKFMDGTYYYPQYPTEASLLLNGLVFLETEIVPFASLENANPYIEYIQKAQGTRNAHKGWARIKENFIDPITKEILIDLHLPTSFLELFLYAQDMLADNSYQRESDNIWRIKGYENINDILFDAISQSYAHYVQYGRSRESFSISEDEVITRLHKSMLVENYDTLNPVNELKMKRQVTFKGVHGINIKEAFNLASRGQSTNSVGTIGLSSIDKSSVGITKQLTMNPRIYSTRGYIMTTEKDELKEGKIPYSSMMTPEEAIVPYITRDDPKRIGFTSGQTKHTIAVRGSAPPAIGTGLESTLLDKASDDFGYKAKQDGKVITLASDHLIVQYKDKTFDRIDIGEVLDRNSNFFLGNNLVANVRQGQSFKAHDVLTYNKDFFKKHMGRLMYTRGAMALVAVSESAATSDDSSTITAGLARRMSTSINKRKQIVLSPTMNIVSAKKLGEHVRHGDPLIVYEDQKGSDADSQIFSLFGEVDEGVLDKLFRHTWGAPQTGVIVDLKVYWTVGPEEMNGSTRAFVTSYIKSVKTKISEEEKITGRVSSLRKFLTVSKPNRFHRINGALVPDDKGILIEYYVGEDHSMIAGDKLTFSSSIKSVVSQILPEGKEPYKFSGIHRKLDAIMSFFSIENRMLRSIYFSGWLGKIVKEYGERLAVEYAEMKAKK